MAGEKQRPSGSCHDHFREAGSPGRGDEKTRRLAAAGKMVEGMADLLALTSARHQTTSADLAGLELSVRTGMPLEELVDQADRMVSERAAVFAEFRKGHVYCYACQSSACEHSRPPVPDQVFAGYEATGAALWVELYSLLLNIGDPRTEMLFRPSPRVVSRHIRRRVLMEEQLVSFGKNSLTYKIWGQVVAGYILIEKTRCALTAQVVETRDHRLRLQTIAPEVLMDSLTESVDGGHSPLRRLHEALSDARRRLESLESTWRNARSREAKRRVREQADSLLRRLSHSIERKGRQKRRRTEHAELRGTQQRPVHKGGEDLADAHTKDFFKDVVKNAYVVLGKGGRAHVFSQDGRQVTSFILTGDELNNRLRRRRYQPMDKDEVQTLREAVNRL